MSRSKASIVSVSAAILALVLAPARAAQARPAHAAASRAAAQPQQQFVSDNSDQTLEAMHDELQRSQKELSLTIPGNGQPARPYFISYRLLDLSVRTIVAEFGALVSSSTGRNMLMSVDVRVGNYNLDNSNFIAEEGFSGFIGSTGTVGIDHDYNSLRQDLWLATDQSFKAAVENLSKKQAFLTRLQNAPTIPDFFPATAVVHVDPRTQPDWTARNWEEEAKTVSAALRGFSQLNSSRVTYHLIYATEYLLTNEGTEIRTTHSLAAIEASLETESSDGMPLHNFLAIYRNRPTELPSADEVKVDLGRRGQELVALQDSRPAADYDGPVLFEAPAAGSLLAQILTPSLSGARGPLATQSGFDQLMERLGGNSEWLDKLGTRVLPTTVTLTDDPSATQFGGQELVGNYDVDEEGVKAQRVDLVSNGILHDLLMSRRPGPNAELNRSNGHGRASFLADPRPMMSNLFFSSSAGMPSADLKKKFLDDCKQNGNKYCLVVRRMDNPVLGVREQDDMSDLLLSAASGAAQGNRLALLVYRVYVDDGHEELVRGAHLTGLTVRSLRNLDGIGSDIAPFQFTQSETQGFAGTALSAFGSADTGVPSTVMAPSLLFNDVEVHGARGEPQRLPLVPAPPMN